MGEWRRKRGTLLDGGSTKKKPLIIRGFGAFLAVWTGLPRLQRRGPKVGGGTKFGSLNAKHSRSFRAPKTQANLIFLRKKTHPISWMGHCVGGLDGTRTRDPMRDRHVF